jgi:hypothetical protein
VAFLKIFAVVPILVVRPNPLESVTAPPLSSTVTV